MTLAVRIIPVLMRRGGSLVKGVKFDSWRSVGHPLQAAKIHAKRAVDELLYLDIGATPEGKGPDLRMADALTSDAFIPVTIGGGVETIDDVDGLLRAGADKVAICTNATSLIANAAQHFGRQALVAGVDVLDGRVVTECGKKITDLNPVDYTKKLEDNGAGEILLQDISLDGAQSGYNLPLVEAISRAVTIPVIASCGCGTYQHMVEAVNAGASAVAAGSMFLFTDSTPRQAAQYLHDAGITVRL